jgi:hypothetical protein
VPFPILVCLLLAIAVIPVAVFTRLAPAQTGTGGDRGAPGSRVALRQLIVATGADDAGLATWKAILDKIGTPYDVLLARTDRLDRSSLVRPDGTGRYNAVLLTDNALLLPDGSGNFVSALSPDEWQTMWEFERTFLVRQVALRTSPTTFPEDYCLRASSEGAVGTTAVEATLSSFGAGIFDYLNPAIRVPVQNSYLYRTSVTPNCNAQPLLTIGSDVAGIAAVAPDGRERAGLTFSLGADQFATDLLGYGLLRWATRGVFLGEQRHWINVDVDDWFAATLRGQPGGTGGTFRLTGPEVAEIDRQQTALRETYPLSGRFTLNIAYNASRFHTGAPAQCDPANTPDDLSSYTRCLADKFRWINHTFSHPAMNDTTYEQNRSEIEKNLDVAKIIGLPVPPTVLKTPEYSGLGVFNADPHSLDSPTDHGLARSNGEMLRAASDLGVKYLHGNMSFDSHRPGCFNCGIYHPLQSDLLVVPDWPTNIAFEATTPEELTAIYNSLHGSQGTGQAERDLSYDEIIHAEAEIALRHLISGSVYAHTLHQGNLHVYEPGKSLTFDWLDAVFDAYSTLYSVPVENPDWPTLADYVRARTSHFAALTDGDDAVWNRSAGSVTYTSTADRTLFLTGAEAEPGPDAGDDRVEKYGSDTISRLDAREGRTITLTARPRQ